MQLMLVATVYSAVGQSWRGRWRWRSVECGMWNVVCTGGGRMRGRRDEPGRGSLAAKRQVRKGLWAGHGRHGSVDQRAEPNGRGNGCAVGGHGTSNSIEMCMPQVRPCRMWRAGDSEDGRGQVWTEMRIRTRETHHVAPSTSQIDASKASLSSPVWPLEPVPIPTGLYQGRGRRHLATREVSLKFRVQAN